jgi:hypothetical protein
MRLCDSQHPHSTEQCATINTKALDLHDGGSEPSNVSKPSNARLAEGSLGVRPGADVMKALRSECVLK